MSSVEVVNTVLGRVAPPGPDRTGNLVSTVPGPDGPSALIVRGCLRRNDGGGGVFVWDAKSTIPDDGGTVLAPNGNGSSTPVPAGRWLRVYSGALDVRWFGAQGRQSVDDTAAFSNAIEASAGTGPAAGAEVFVPKGEFRARVRLPKLGINGRGISIRGAGVRATQVVWANKKRADEMDEPVVDFEGDNATYVLNYRFSSIQFRHLAPGATVFRHAPNGGPGRVMYAVFEDVAFVSPGVAADGDPKLNPPVAELRSLFNCRLDRVLVRGSGGLLVEGSRNHLVDIRTRRDYLQTNGIVLDHCGESVIDVPRVDGLKGTLGDGIAVIASRHVTIRNASFEGKGGRSCIRIERSSDVTLDNCNMGGGKNGASDWAALSITGKSQNIRVNGGRINVNDRTGIRIEAGCRSIRAVGIEYPGSTLKAVSNTDPNGASTTFLVVDPDAADVCIDVLPYAKPEQWTNDLPESRSRYTHTTTTAGRRVRFRPIGRPGQRRVHLVLERWEAVVVSRQALDPSGTAPTATWTVENVGQGGRGEAPAPASPGRRVTLFLKGGGIRVASGGPARIRLHDNQAWTPAGDAVLELVWDGDVWWEVARNG